MNTLKSSFLKTSINISLFLLVINIFQALTFSKVLAQCNPYIMIDGEATSPSSLSLPYWLHQGQTLSMNSSVNAISVIEFNVNANSLEFSDVLSVSSTSTVPIGKVWKIESIASLPINGTIQNVVTYSTPGTYSFKVPNCTNYICIEAWGGGGGGGGTSVTSGSGGGGGGGGYGTACFVVAPDSVLTVIVGAGGNQGVSNSNGTSGGTSSVGTLISATGGIYGNSVSSAIGGSGGNGGTSTASVNIPGEKGVNGITGNCGYGGKGGNGGNGGAGGNGGGCASGSNGVAPGGGGGGGNSSPPKSGGYGASGQVKISW